MQQEAQPSGLERPIWYVSSQHMTALIPPPHSVKHKRVSAQQHEVATQPPAVHRPIAHLRLKLRLPLLQRCVTLHQGPRLLIQSLRTLLQGSGVPLQRRLLPLRCLLGRLLLRLTEGRKRQGWVS